MTTIKNLVHAIRTHLPGYLRRDTTDAEERQQAVASISAQV